MSKWAEFYLEQDGTLTIEETYGFITYRIRGDECLIPHFFVDKENRSAKKGVELANKVKIEAINNGCKYLSCILYSLNPFVTNNLRIFINYGFEIDGVSGDFILLKMSLEDK